MPSPTPPDAAEKPGKSTPPVPVIVPAEAVAILLLLLGAVLLLLEGRQRVSLMEQGTAVREELALVASALENRPASPDTPPGEELAFHEYSAGLPADSPLRSGRDSMGSRLGLQPASGEVRVPKSTWEKLRYIVDDDFWSPWTIPGPTPLSGNPPP